MNKMLITRFVQVILVFIFMLPSLSFSAQDRRTALVIGNGSYQSSPLRNPVNDAKDIAEALRNLGFSVSLKTDANLRTMKQSIKNFGRNLRMGGVGLFYYAGHGLQVNGRNYLVPIGADVNTESEIEYEAVNAGRILGQMEDAGNGLNIIILDACRDNPFARSFRSSEKGLAKMNAPTGSFLAYATAPGSVAADGTGRNGLYTSKLLKYMVTPGLELEKLFKYVRIEVANASGATQVPWESSSLMGDFYFNPKRGIAITQLPESESQKPVQSYKSTGNRQDQKNLLAYIPKAPAKVQPDSRPAVAIFPSKIDATWTTSVDIIRALKEIFIESPLFFAKFSYYDLGLRSKITLLNKNTFPPDTINKFWLKKTFFSNQTPNVDLICKLGKKLPVDFVLLYYTTTVGYADVNYYVFVINIKTKKLYSKMGSKNYSGNDSLLELVKIDTEMVLNDSVRDK